MPVSIQRESLQIITVRVSGRLSEPEWQGALADALKLVPGDERASILIQADGFEGWDQGRWEYTASQQEFDRRIDRMAIVAAPQWRDQAMLFTGQGIRQFAIEFFTPAEAVRARQWLMSCS
jgi:hypothetical protein